MDILAGFWLFSYNLLWYNDIDIGNGVASSGDFNGEGAYVS
jgi:hypothetical protein